MKEIIYNYDYLIDEDVNNVVGRAKILVENSKGEVLIVYSHKNYFLLVIMLKKMNLLMNVLLEKLKKKLVLKYHLKKRKPFFSIIYYNIDYPEKNLNSKFITNYYSIKYDLIPNLDNINLTDDEKDENFKLQYIDRNKIIEVLTNSLDTCTRPNVVKDTIEVLKEYLIIN